MDTLYLVLEKVGENNRLVHKTADTALTHISVWCEYSSKKALVLENVDYLIVLENDKFQGVITDHDIASKILFEDRPLNKIPVKEFMSRTLPVATPYNSFEYCMQLMERYNVRHLAIFDRFEFRGVVSSYDLMQEAFNKRKGSFEEENIIRQGYPWNY